LFFAAPFLKTKRDVVVGWSVISPSHFSPISTSLRIASERPISFLEMERMTHLAEQGQRSVSVEAEVAILVGRDQCD
jgi:hypothetical protein